MNQPVNPFATAPAPTAPTSPSPAQQPVVPVQPVQAVQPVQPVAAAPVQQAPAPVVTGGVSTPTSADSDPYGASTPVGLSGLKMNNPMFMNQLLLVEPIEFIDEIKTARGAQSAVRANIIPLTGPQAGILQPNITVWQEALKRELRDAHNGPDRWLLAVLYMGEQRGQNNPPYLFREPLPEERAIYDQFRAAQRQAQPTQ
jgi:hypothetical protein